MSGAAWVSGGGFAARKILAPSLAYNRYGIALIGVFSGLSLTQHEHERERTHAQPTHNEDRKHAAGEALVPLW